MRLIDIETVITWLYNNIDNYDLQFNNKNLEERNWYDLKIDLRKLAEGEK